MSRLRVFAFSISIDGFGAGPDQDLENPLGVRGPEIFDWFFHTRTFQRMHGDAAAGEGGVDDDIAADPSAVRGRTTAGRAGGAKSRLITCPRSS
jgi:hypothetical protein